MLVQTSVAADMLYVTVEVLPWHSFFHHFFHLCVIKGEDLSSRVRMDVTDLSPPSFEPLQHPRGSSLGLVLDGPARSRGWSRWSLWVSPNSSCSMTGSDSPPLLSATTMVGTHHQSKAQTVPEIIPNYSIIHELFSGKLPEKPGKTNLIIIS